ncbi:hypothetical protein CBR_g38014 [Chara braunii]|uniref:Uncharacterized protein n=1 Tax=Chara braunii TaxID=69332 RepID=A0A388K027_CHABU|nr:hypothetical protein CBR_g38014 [Chara braunii]|eukprot:GBG63392.1 hypothetical protein CBR_g38014 [Chara braunii]
METQDMVKGIAGVSNEGISAGANTTDCAVALAGICAQAADLSTDGDTSDDGAECLVPYENVERTRAGGHFPYDVNWVPGRLQPGTVGGTPCFAFKVNGEWVPYPAPTETSWRCVTLSIIFDRVLRLNDAATPDEKSRHVLKLWRVLDAKGDLRLNDFEYDSVDCGESWVIGGLDTTAGSVCAETDARRDPRWGWVPHDAPLLCGRVRMPMRDAMGNVWTVCYISGSFMSRHLNREVAEEEKMTMVCPTAAARCFSPPLRNLVELEVAEGKVFAGEQGYTYTHARGEEATADGLSPLVWNPPNLKPDVLAAMDIMAHVIPEGQLQHHVAPQKYGYRMVEQWQFLVVLARVSIFNADVKEHVLVVEHAKRCWEKIREEDRQMVCMGYDSMPKQGMWSMVEGSPGGQGQGDEENMYMAHIRRRHGCSAHVGWVPPVCRLTYEQGGEMTIRFKDPLGLPFLLTYSDGLLRDIRYMVHEDIRGGLQRPGQTEETRLGHQGGLSAEVEGPRGSERVAGCSAAQADVAGPSNTAMSHSPRKVKGVVSRPQRGKPREEVERQSICIMSMSVAQVAKALAEVMKYAEERFHYNDRGELSLVEERVPRYFAVTVDMRSTIMANGSGCEMDNGPLVCDCGRPFMSLRTLNSHRARACPAVVEEGAQRQENNVAHDPRPSDMGAANLAADDSDDAGAEDNANGAAGDNAEPEAQLVEPFDNSRRLAALILSARGGVGMSHCDVDALLSLLKDSRFSAADIAYRNSRKCFAWAGSLPEAAGWKESDLRSDDWPEGAHAILWHRDWRTAFLSIMQVALQKCETVHSLEVSPPSDDHSVSLKPAGKKDKCWKKSGAEKRESKEHRRSGAGLSTKTAHRRRRKSESKVTVPSSERDISTLKERNESPPSTPVGGKRGRGVENRPPKAPEKKSRDDRSATTHRSSKKRISYKDERPVETIDLGGSDDGNNTPQAKEEEEHDRSTPEKSDGAEDEEGGNEGDDSGPSRGQSQDTDEDDNSDNKSASQSTGEDRSAASEGDDSPSPSRTLRSEGERQARNGSDIEEPVGDRQIMQHVSATGKEDTFFAAVQATAKLAGGTAEEGLRSHIAERGIRAVIGECNKIMTTIRGEITWQLKHWFWAEKGIPLVGSHQSDHHLPARNKMRAEMKENKTWRRSGDDPWGVPAFKTTLLKVFQMRKEGRNLGVTLQQLAFAEMVIQCEIEQTTKTTRVAEQIEKLVSIKQAIVSSLRARDTRSDKKETMVPCILL